MVIGTHTLFQENFKPYNLSYVVIDEQHRFGVNQRDELLKKTKIPHILSMSATPIPRSLALTIYGDLNISSIKKVPAIRKPIKTRWCRNDDEKLNAYEKVLIEVNKGNQAFIVCPLIHKSEKINAVSIEEIREDLLSSRLNKVKYDFLHGEMDINEKSQIMENFKNKHFDLLIATPVIEVGVDIPNATCIIIESADRFGMAQLHQIRGRVGRSDKESYCYLFTRNLSEESVERLSLFKNTKNGFDLAEADLKLRGPGDYIGSRQSGISDISYKMISDEDTLKISRNWAESIVFSKIKLGSEYSSLRNEYKKRFKALHLGPSYQYARSILAYKFAMDKAMKKAGKFPTQDQVIAAMKNINFKSYTETISMARGGGHQAVHSVGYGLTKYNKKGKTPGAEKVKMYGPECIYPPAGTKSEDWINAGMPGAKCK